MTGKQRWSVWGILFGAALFSAACGRAETTSASGNTNWLKCNDDSECGGGGNLCQCNVCTPSCDGMLDCGQPPEQICTQPSGTQSGDTPPGDSQSGEAPKTQAVIDCETSIATVRAACVAEDATSVRLCVYDAFLPLCSKGRTEFVKQVFDCLQQDVCMLPGIPGQAADCVQSVIHAAAGADEHALGAVICDKCSQNEPGCFGSDVREPASSLANAMLLKPSDIPAVTSCMDNTCENTGKEEDCWDQTLLATANHCP